MKLKLAHAISILVVVFSLSLTAYACENNSTPKTTPDPAVVDPAVIAVADKILAEQADASVTVSDNSSVASNAPDAVLSTASKGSVSKWLEHRALSESDARSRTESHAVAKHAHYQEIETDMGGGWCDLCGCWMHHGLDPNGTPQSEIGHPYVCTGGASSQNCWSHYYTYCFSS